MHRSTRDQLEGLLTRGSRQEAPGKGAEQVEVATESHLRGCAECALELRLMREQAELVRTLRAPGDFEPASGFYARVLQRIEQRAKRSIWYGLVYSPVGKRLAYASLSLALALGLYVIAAEQMDRPVATKPTIAQQNAPEVSGAGTPTEQRDAVLVNFASYGPASR